MWPTGHSATIQSHTTCYGTEIMTYDHERPELDAQMIILGLGYATGLLVIVGWVATHVM